MKISVADAQEQLIDLVRRAEAGDEIVLTRHDKPVVRLTPIRKRLTPDERLHIMEAARAAAAHAKDGTPAARTQDFLYDEDGLPGWSSSTPRH